MLEKYFPDTVAAGWAPRNPCTDPAELATLEQSLARGDCIAPLIQAGDILYIDRAMKPEPGDVVSFTLSERGAQAQNSALPAGQSLWERGAHWCKLLGMRHGFHMLHDRHGSAATATLMACESPDDAPVLHPVRQICRGGRMLFGTDSHSAQIGLNAATSIYESTAAGPINISTASPSKTLVTTVTVPAAVVDTNHVISFLGSVTLVAGTSVPSGGLVNIYIGTITQLTGQSFAQAQVAGQTVSSMFSDETVNPVTAGTAITYNFYGSSSNTSGASGTVSNITAKVEVVKR